MESFPHRKIYGDLESFETGGYVCLCVPSCIVVVVVIIVAGTVNYTKVDLPLLSSLIFHQITP